MSIACLCGGSTRLTTRAMQDPTTDMYTIVYMAHYGSVYICLHKHISIRCDMHLPSGSVLSASTQLMLVCLLQQDPQAGEPIVCSLSLSCACFGKSIPNECVYIQRTYIHLLCNDKHIYIEHCSFYVCVFRYFLVASDEPNRSRKS